MQLRSLLSLGSQAAVALLSVSLLVVVGCADPPPGGNGDGNNGGSVNNGGVGTGANNGGANNGGANNGGDGTGGTNGTGTDGTDGHGDPLVDTCTDEPTEDCDGLDNNCNGVVDEGCSCTQAEQACYTGPASTVNVGECSQGSQTCEGEFYGECVGALLPTNEVCDDLDNDCDGQVDEGFDVGGRCGDGTGGCAAQGTWRCTPTGDVECNVVNVEPSEERCDGLDNDCDGQIDEDFTDLDEPCTMGLGVCANTGHVICSNDGAGTLCSALPFAPQQERCDALDNNCNGSADENWPGLGQPCTAGVGACARQGTLRCAADARDAVCDAQPGAPTAETCDGIDNNCDGSVDELPECSNHDPVVSCPADMTLSTLDTANLTATASDPDGGALTTGWTIVTAPTGSTRQNTPTTGNSTSLFLELAGGYVLRFTATDSTGATASCETRVTSLPSEQFRVELIWNIGASNDHSDVDLHLLNTSRGTWLGSADCHFRNCDSSSGANLEWGAGGSADNPRLDLDDVDGNGPENINIDDPENATYRIGVHYWDEDGFGDSSVVLRIYCNGQIAREFEPVVLSAVGVNASGNDFWLAADVTWNGAVCQVNELGSPGNRTIVTTGSL